MNKGVQELFPVDKCDSIYDFVIRMETKYKENTAFICKDQPKSYGEFSEDIRKCIAYFNDFSKTYFCINIDDAYCFGLAFFAITGSGNIAVLSEEPVTKDPTGSVDITLINERFIRELTEKHLPIQGLPQCDPTLPSVIAQSSGTTSVSKGVVLSQKAILSDMYAGMSCNLYAEGARYLHIIPYSHLFGLTGDFLGPLYAGATIVDSGNRLNFIRDLKEYEISCAALPPVAVNGLCKMIRENGVENVTGGFLKKILCAGAQPDFDVYREMSGYGIRILTGYGLTECAPCVSMTGEFADRIGSCGKPLICNEVRIEDGEILVRGSNLMIGYWEDSISTDKVFKDGWLLTGDLGYIDEDGFLFVTGRKSSLIVFDDGTKLLPDNLEEKIDASECVRESLVYADKKDNRVCINICVVPNYDTTGNECKSAVSEVLKEEGYFDRLGQIILTDKALERTKLGKLKRKNKATNSP